MTKRAILQLRCPHCGLPAEDGHSPACPRRPPEPTRRRIAFVEEWEPGQSVEVFVTGEVREEQLQAIESFIARARQRLSTSDGESMREDV